nr:MAG TPA: hypothetical protein [Caudoviricetes sp.]DAU62105.1 MAG TPA: hypothetical protein [Crassvirales sp.]DAM53483.1 MAG TPA: hypothetical protein [Caudoviricetes sp.]DAR40532.1 MAG TPA: hypothetical protein [Caudoviricetes sp.]DAU67071.1 MAG TPA: hypothetical protein [Caudoviricetes sp.]
MADSNKQYVLCKTFKSYKNKKSSRLSQVRRRTKYF